MSCQMCFVGVELNGDEPVSALGGHPVPILEAEAAPGGVWRQLGWVAGEEESPGARRLGRVS